jgi:hypothetical protein
MQEVLQVIQYLAWCESLGLALICSQDCNTAIAVWDTELRVWLDDEDEPFAHQCIAPQCAECGKFHALPPKEHVETWIAENSPS